MSKRVLAAAWILASSASLALGQERLPWRNAAELGPNAALLQDKDADGPVVQITGVAGRPTIATVLAVHKPNVPSHLYQVGGRIKYENVEGDGYVEMWSFFPDGGQYVSRTGDPSGPMGALMGTSGWRDLVLPFMSKPALLPERIEVRVILPGKGKVFIAPLTLSGTAFFDTAASGWWSERSAGWLGGLGGGFIGILGGTIGVLAGFGKARRLVIGLCIFCIAIGATAVLVGVVAVLVGQPWHVYYPLLLGGGIAATVCGFNLPALMRRYQQMELRRMTAMDA
ncbi:MAG: hypothetical protein L0215_14385 [Gemmataceae bacterium]|nr:hypothetical protein [Gemmataceae bacterium]